VNARQWAELVALAALWGGSFLFMRLAAGEFGPLALAAVRVAVAAAVLAPLLWWHRLGAELRRHWRAIAVVGGVNSALPFVAYSYAALSINAGLASIFNATVPLWGALLAWAWLGERPRPQRAAGLAIGFGGVVWLAWGKAGAGAPAVTGAVLACLAASALYGFGANYTRQRLVGASPLAVAGGSQIAATLMLAAPAAAHWPAAAPSPLAWGAAIALGAACTGLAYLLFFRLIARAGAAHAMSVTYLIPLFGVGWGWLLLDERVTATMLGGGATILLGTALATGVFGPRPAAGTGAAVRG
jgi:drug/metabolite transporter (DMT)-like permease